MKGSKRNKERQRKQEKKAASYFKDEGKSRYARKKKGQAERKPRLARIWCSGCYFKRCICDELKKRGKK